MALRGSSLPGLPGCSSSAAQSFPGGRQRQAVKPSCVAAPASRGSSIGSRRGVAGGEVASRQQQALGMLLQHHQHQQRERPLSGAPAQQQQPEPMRPDRLEALYALVATGRQPNFPVMLPEARPPRRDDEAAALSFGVQLDEPASRARDDARERSNSSTGSSTSRGAGGGNNGNGKDPDFYLNAGLAIRVLREDIPALFQEDLDCE